MERRFTLKQKDSRIYKNRKYILRFNLNETSSQIIDLTEDELIQLNNILNDFYWGVEDI